MILLLADVRHEKEVLKIEEEIDADSAELLTSFQNYLEEIGLFDEKIFMYCYSAFYGVYEHFGLAFM